MLIMQKPKEIEALIKAATASLTPDNYDAILEGYDFISMYARMHEKEPESVQELALTLDNVVLNHVQSWPKEMLSRLEDKICKSPSPFYFNLGSQLYDIFRKKSGVLFDIDFCGNAIKLLESGNFSSRAS